MTFDGYQSGAINNDNGIGFAINWWLAAGSTYSGGTLSSNTWHNTQANRAVGQVNLADSTSNYLNITGVQLEVGDTPTPFEHRPYDMELQRCFRYFETLGGGNVHGGSYSGATTIGHLQYKARKRAIPTVSGTTGNNISSVVAGIDNFHFTGSQPSYVITALIDAEL